MLTLFIFLSPSLSLSLALHLFKTSGGMKRRLALALAFCGSPKILLLDEPSSGCDSWTRELVRKDILLRKENTAVLVSTHHIDDVEVLSDRLWFLNERYLAFDGPLDDLTALGSSSPHSAPTRSQDDITEGTFPSPPPPPPPSIPCTGSTTHDTTHPEQLKRPHSFDPDTFIPPQGLTDLSMHVDLQFSTWSEEVMRTFRREFSSANANAWLMDRCVSTTASTALRTAQNSSLSVSASICYDRQNIMFLNSCIPPPLSSPFHPALSPSPLGP
jgi:hypothetical protein